MKKSIIAFCWMVAVLSVVIMACEKKENADAIQPTFGSTGNPNPNNPTVTGNVTYTNPATDNTSLRVGGTGWSNPTCGTTYSIMLKASNDLTDVTVSFPQVIKTGTYLVTASPTPPSQCAVTIVNAPGQPGGIVWYGKSGIVTVNTTSSSISASLTGVICTQQTFNFPTVSVSGDLGCSP
jgi:hypothetical protein